MPRRPTPRVVAYLRVSSRSQTHELQRNALEQAAAARGDQVVAWYTERQSARTIRRPVLEDLRRDVAGGDVQRLYVYRLDRLTRSGIRDTFELVEELQAHGCELVTVADGFDLNGPAADVILAVLAWSAKMERLAINERISAARDRLEAEGRPWGRPSRLEPRHHTRIAQLRNQGRTVREIAVAMKIPRSTVGRALSRNPPRPRPAGNGRPPRRSHPRP